MSLAHHAEAVLGKFRHDSSMISLGLKVLGAAWILQMVSSLASFALLNFTNFSAIDIKKRYAKAGTWAVVTGGSEGIGFALANELAAKGMNIAIIALGEPRLAEAAGSIAADHGVKTLAVPFNFASADADAYSRLFNQLDADLESAGGIAILVNNVGVFYKYPMPFEVVDVKEDMRLVKLNIEPQLMMTKWILPKLKRKGCGAIVTTSSISAVIPAPFLSTYSGTKSFNRGFARSLEGELLDSGIDSLIITPHVVNTRMASNVPAEKRAATMMVDPAPLARDAISKLGVVGETAGHRFHCVLRAIFLSLPPRRLLRRGVERTKEAYELAAQKEALEK